MMNNRARSGTKYGINVQKERKKENIERRRNEKKDED
jgi:hypothetical protein